MSEQNNQTNVLKNLITNYQFINNNLESILQPFNYSEKDLEIKKLFYQNLIKTFNLQIDLIEKKNKTDNEFSELKKLAELYKNQIDELDKINKKIIEHLKNNQNKKINEDIIQLIDEIKKDLSLLLQKEKEKEKEKDLIQSYINNLKDDEKVKKTNKIRDIGMSK